MAGTVIVDTINSSVAGTPPVFQANGTEVGTLCRAWVNFNGTGTVAIRASFNVSSITDNGVGNYTVNLTNALSDANYSFLGIASNLADNTTTGILIQGATTASDVRFQIRNDTGVAADRDNVCVAIFR